MFNGRIAAMSKNCTWISQVCKIGALLPKGRNFTYLEDPGIEIFWIHTFPLIWAKEG